MYCIYVQCSLCSGGNVYYYTELVKSSSLYAIEITDEKKIH